MSEQRDSGVMLRLVYEAMQKSGVDADQVLKRLGINEDYLFKADLRNFMGLRFFSGRLWKRLPVTRISV